MGGPIFNLKGWTNPKPSMRCTKRMRQIRTSKSNHISACNHLGAEDVYFLPSEVTSYTGVTGVNEGYDPFI